MLVVRGELQGFFVGQRYTSYFDREADGVADSENERSARHNAELRKRFERRHQYEVVESASKQRENFEVDSWFFMVANSEYCSDTLSTLKWEYSVEEFLELSSLIDYYNDLKQAAELDHKSLEAKNKALNTYGQNSA